MSDPSRIALLKKSIRFWRACFFLIFMLFIIFVPYCDFSNFLSSGFLNKSSANYIARIQIDGPIYHSIQRDDRLKKISDDSSIIGVLVHIDSPGGGASDSESLYNSLRKISNKKPIVSVLGSVATSGAYMAAIATDAIFARNTTTTCSIGVVIEYLNITDLLQKIGVDVEYLRSGVLKAAPSAFTNMTPEERNYLQSTVDEDFDYFVSLVAERRALPAEKIIAYQGKSCSGASAVSESFVDYIGYEEDALAWLKDKKGVDGKVVDISLQQGYSPEAFSLFNFFNKVFEKMLHIFVSL